MSPDDTDLKLSLRCLSLAAELRRLHELDDRRGLRVTGGQRVLGTDQRVGQLRLTRWGANHPCRFTICNPQRPHGLVGSMGYCSLTAGDG